MPKFAWFYAASARETRLNSRELSNKSKRRHLVDHIKKKRKYLRNKKIFIPRVAITYLAKSESLRLNKINNRPREKKNGVCIRKIYISSFTKIFFLSVKNMCISTSKYYLSVSPLSPSSRYYFYFSDIYIYIYFSLSARSNCRLKFTFRNAGAQWNFPTTVLQLNTKRFDLLFLFLLFDRHTNTRFCLELPIFVRHRTDAPG